MFALILGSSFFFFVFLFSFFFGPKRGIKLLVTGDLFKGFSMVFLNLAFYGVYAYLFDTFGNSQPKC